MISQTLASLSFCLLVSRSFSKITERLVDTFWFNLLGMSEMIQGTLDILWASFASTSGYRCLLYWEFLTRLFIDTLMQNILSCGIIWASNYINLMLLVIWLFVCHTCFHEALDGWYRLPASYKLLWRHNGRDGFSNHLRLECLPNRLFRRRSRETPSSASLAFVRGIHRWPVNSPHKGPVTRKMFPLDDVIMPFFWVSNIRVSLASTMEIFPLSTSSLRWEIMAITNVSFHCFTISRLFTHLRC